MSFPIITFLHNVLFPIELVIALPFAISVFYILIHPHFMLLLLIHSEALSVLSVSHLLEDDSPELSLAHLGGSLFRSSAQFYLLSSYWPASESHFFFFILCLHLFFVEHVLRNYLKTSSQEANILRPCICENGFSLVNA